MSSRPTALSVSFLLFLLRVRSVDSTEGFPPPEVDGSAVDGPCRIFPVTTPSAATPPAAPPDSRKVTAAPRKPAVQPPPRKPTSQNTGAPIRNQPASAGPITNSLSTPGSLLLHYLLANSRGRPDSYAPAQGLPGYWLLPVARHPARHTHSPTNWLTHTHRRKISSSSSEEFDD